MQAGETLPVERKDAYTKDPAIQLFLAVSIPMKVGEKKTLLLISLPVFVDVYFDYCMNAVP